MINIEETSVSVVIASLQASIQALDAQIGPKVNENAIYTDALEKNNALIADWNRTKADYQTALDLLNLAVEASKADQEPA